MTNIPEQRFDKRTIERNLQQGVIGRKDYDKYLEDLPDRSDNAEMLDPLEGAGGASSQAEESIPSHSESGGKEDTDEHGG